MPGGYSLLNSEAMERIRPDAVSGVVRMGATNYYATLVLPALLTEFSRRYPSIQIDLEVGTAEDMQRKLGPRFDLTINAFQGGQGNGVLLHRDPVVWATARRGDAERKDPLPLALLPQGSLLRRWAEQTLARTARRWVLVQ